MHEVGVYVHIPFCLSKCYYCDFLSFSYDEDFMVKYISKLLDEIARYNFSKVDTVFIGGGTPTILPPTLLNDVLTCISDLPLAANAEISIEVNPGTVTKEYLRMIKSSGVNRLSFGLQSTLNNQLALIGRTHTYEQFLESYVYAIEVGFSNINVDLIFGLPGQTSLAFEKTLTDVLNLEPQHLSFYGLSLSEDTSLWLDVAMGKISLPDDEVERKMYHKAVQILKDNNYLHYEISNAAKIGYACVHNVDCWQHKPYIGFGLGAHSFDGKKRWSNPTNFDDYFSNVVIRHEVLSDEDLISEGMILGLRLLNGVDELAFESRYGVRPSTFFSSQICKLVHDGLLEHKSQRIRLTSLGLDLANRVFLQFLPGEKQ